MTEDNNDSVKYDNGDNVQTTLLGLDSAGGFRALSLHIRVGQDRGTGLVESCLHRQQLLKELGDGDKDIVRGTRAEEVVIVSHLLWK